MIRYWIEWNSIVDCLEELASKQQQWDLWYNGVGGQSSIEECNECLFTDSQLGSAISDGLIRDLLLGMIEELGLLIGVVPCHLIFCDWIDSKEMDELRSYASVVLEAVQKHLTRKTAVDVMTNFKADPIYDYA